jgi:multidrug resistance efflux pump
LKANLAAANAFVEQARANRDRSKQSYERYVAGNRGATRPFSEQQVEVRRLTYLSDEAALKHAEATEEKARFAANSEIDGVNTTVARLRAEVDNAAYELEQTTVRAPADGYVTTVALSPSQRLTTFPLQPAMTFIDRSRRRPIAAQIGQIYHRHIKSGQLVELAFKTRAGKIFKGVVDDVVQVSGQGQIQTSGTVPLPEEVQPLPFYVTIKLDDGAAASDMPAGTVGTAAIYTETATMTHIIRKVMIRMESYMNYFVLTM